jgi:hypothetical protein
MPAGVYPRVGGGGHDGWVIAFLNVLDDNIFVKQPLFLIFDLNAV